MAERTAPQVWYVVVALPFSQFLLGRWLWKWSIWAFAMARIALQPLATLATHPDHAGGLACLARPLSGFAGFAFACGATLAGAWGNHVLAGTMTMKSQMPTLLAFLLVLLAIAGAPYLPFSGHLYRARRRGLAEYGDFAHEYMWGFHRKWVRPRTEQEAPLGSPDIQSLNDLGGAFSVISKTRFFVFSLRPILAIWLGALLPMTPLFLPYLSVEMVLKRIFSAVLGGVPV